MVKKTLKYILASFGVFMLSACVRDAEFYRNQSSMQLCLDYMALPSVNINHGARAEELKRRNEDCSAYKEVAASRIKANENQSNSLQRSLNQQQNPVSFGNQVKQPIAFFKRTYISGFNRICIYDRMGSQFVTTLQSTDICPLTLE